MIAEKRSVQWRKLLVILFTEAKCLHKRKDILKSFTLFCQINSPLLEHTAYNSAKYDCQEFLRLCARFVQNGKLLHQHITKKNEIHFLLKSEDQLY